MVFDSPITTTLTDINWLITTYLILFAGESVLPFAAIKVNRGNVCCSSSVRSAEDVDQLASNAVFHPLFAN